MHFSPSSFAPEILVLLDGFGRPVPWVRPLNLNSQVESGHRSSRLPRRGVQLLYTVNRHWVFLGFIGPRNIVYRWRSFAAESPAGTGPVVVQVAGVNGYTACSRSPMNQFRAPLFPRPCAIVYTDKKTTETMRSGISDFSLANLYSL